MKFKDHVYEYETVVLGGTVEAAVYAFLNNALLIYNKPKPPFRFDYYEEDLNFFGFSSEGRELNTRKGHVWTGASKLSLYRHLIFTLSLSGLLPYGNKVQKLSIEGGHLKVVTGPHGVFKIRYDQLIVFDEEDIVGLPGFLKEEEKKYKVIDWINVRSGMTHPYDYFKTEDEFVNELYFYPSDRIDGNHIDKKDLVTVSHLSREQLVDVDYSDFYVRFKVEKLMKEAGVMGRKNGYVANNPQKRSYRALKIEPFRREVMCETRNKHENSGNIIFNYDSLTQALETKDSVNNDAYAFNISKKIYLK